MMLVILAGKRKIKRLNDTNNWALVSSDTHSRARKLRTAPWMIKKINYNLLDKNTTETKLLNQRGTSSAIISDVSWLLSG